MRNLSSGASQSVAVVLSRREVEFPADAVYVRPLNPKECSRQEVLKLIQNSEVPIEEVYGVFDQIGIFVGAGANRELAFEFGEDIKCKPQMWLC